MSGGGGKEDCMPCMPALSSVEPLCIQAGVECVVTILGRNLLQANTRLATYCLCAEQSLAEPFDTKRLPVTLPDVVVDLFCPLKNAYFALPSFIRCKKLSQYCLWSPFRTASQGPRSCNELCVVAALKWNDWANNQTANLLSNSCRSKY